MEPKPCCERCILDTRRPSRPAGEPSRTGAECEARWCRADQATWTRLRGVLSACSRPEPSASGVRADAKPNATGGRAKCRARGRAVLEPIQSRGVAVSDCQPGRSSSGAVCEPCAFRRVCSKQCGRCSDPCRVARCCPVS